MFSKPANSGKVVFLIGLFFVVLSASVFASHYFKHNYRYAAFQESPPPSDNSSPPPSDSSSPPPSDSSTSTSPTTTTNTWDGGSSTTTYDSTTGTTTYTYTYTWTDPSTGQQVTSTSTSTTYTDPSTGQQTTTSTWSGAGGGGTSTTTYDPATGTSTSTSTYSYVDPLTGETKTSNSQSTSSTDPNTGITTSTSTGDWGSSTYYYDPNTGTSTSESTYIDPMTGETRTSKSESSSTSYTDESGATVYEYKSTYDYYDPLTGEQTTQTSTSSSKSVTNSDGSTTYYSESTWTDPQTGEPVKSTSESTYDPDTGESKSTSTYTDPTTGQTYTSYSSSVYNSETGEGSSTYTYTDPSTGQTITSTSSTVKNEDGTYTSTYTYTDPVTGETVDSPYYGVFGKESSGTSYTYLDTDTGATYDYQYEGSPPSDVSTYMTPDGSTYVYTDTTDELNALADAYGDSFASAIDVGLPVGETENHFIEKEGIEGVVTTEIIGEPVIPYSEFVEQIEARSDKEELSDVEQQIITQEYENFEEGLTTANELNEKQLDPAPETYQEYTEMYERYSIPKEQQLIKSPEDFEAMINMRLEFYTQRDEIYSNEEFSTEERTAAQRELENEFAKRYEEQFGSIEIAEPLPEPGTLPSRGEGMPAETLSILSPEAIEAMIEDKYQSRFEELEGKNIPTNHPYWKSLETQASAEKDDWLNEQRTVLIDVAMTGCQGSVGGSSTSCGQMANLVDATLAQCGTGDAGSNCKEVAQVIATQLPCDSVSDKSSCLGEAARIATEVKDNIDTPIADAWMYGVEIVPEKIIGEDTYETYRNCASEGGSDCTSKYDETFDGYAVEQHEVWRAQYESLTPEQYDQIQQESEVRQQALNSEIEPVLDILRSELPAEQKPVFNTIEQRFDQYEDGRLELMQLFRNAVESDGHDTALLDFYIEQSEHSLYASKDSLAHENYISTVGNLQQFNEYFELYMQEARNIAQADNAGTTYEAPEELTVE